MLESVIVVREGRRWAVKHNGGFLGFTASEEEAVCVAKSLLSHFDEEGRAAELVLEGGQPFSQAS